MTLGQATKYAISYFERKEKNTGKEFRGAIPQEFSGIKSILKATIKIVYAINGDYTESDKVPYIITVNNEGARVITYKE